MASSKLEVSIYEPFWHIRKVLDYFQILKQFLITDNLTAFNERKQLTSSDESSDPEH